MKTKNSNIKTYLLSTLLTGAVLAGTYADLKLKSDSFMYEDKLDIVSLSVEETSRVLASRVNPFNSPAVQYIGLTSENKKKINGKWEVTRVLDTKGNAMYDPRVREEDKNSLIIVDMSLYSTSTIQLDKNPNQHFKVSLLTEHNTIALFKIINGGYEILEAKKILPKKKVIALEKNLFQASKQSVTTSPKRKGIRMKDVDLRLESALNPVQSRNILNIKQVSGELGIFDGNIQNFSAALNTGSDNEVNVSFDFAQINDGGQFNTEINGEMASGIITNNGETSYKIRFATGPLQGAILTFVNDAQYEKTQEKFANFEAAREVELGEARARQNLKNEQLELEREARELEEEEREFERENREDEEVVRFESNEEKLEHVEKFGFSFGNDVERVPSSN